MTSYITYDPGEIVIWGSSREGRKESWFDARKYLNQAANQGWLDLHGKLQIGLRLKTIPATEELLTYIENNGGAGFSWYIQEDGVADLINKEPKPTEFDF